MKLFVLLFFIAALIQTSFLPVNLCLVLMICRSFIRNEENNYPVAFFGGIFLGVLSTQNIAFWALIFLIIVKLIKVFKKLPFSSNFFTILPVSFAIITMVAFLEQVVFGQSINLIKIIVETIILLPIYILMLVWEERFVVKHDIKLKIKN